jgi:hypothetical protein
MFPKVLLAVACVVGASPLSAGERPSAEKKSYPPPPWHLVDLWWSIGIAMPFESYSIDVEISDDVPSTVNLYVAPIGLGHLGKTPFYGGIQTQADGYTKRDQNLRQIGPGFIFSMWGERSLDGIRPSIGGFCQSSGHEGDFISVRRPYEWKKGKYTYKVVRMDKEEIDGKPVTWVGSFVYSHATDENIFVGALRFKGENLVLSKDVASFVEIYGRRIPVDQIPKVTVTFGNLVVNGKAAQVVSAHANYPKEVPDYADAVAKEGAIIVKVGEPVENRKDRNVRLIEKPAAATSMKGWELYIWQKDGDTYFSLLRGTNRLKTDEEITGAAVKGIDAIKPKLDELKPGEMVFPCGRRLPDVAPQEPAKAIKDHCHKLGLDVRR